MKPQSWEFLNYPGPIPVAHRGGMGEAGQNTIAAIERCAELNCYVETDISVTADGHAVLWHPTGIDRIRPRRSLGPEVKGSQISDFEVTRVGGTKVVPLLRDVLGSYPDLRLMIDVKQWPAVMPTAQAIADTHAVGRVSIGTFIQSRTDATARAIFDLTGKRVCTGIGIPAVGTLALRAMAKSSAWQSTAQLAQLPAAFVTPRIISAAHRGGLAVMPWTVNTEGEMHRMIHLGVDGIITDFPSKLVSVLAGYARGDATVHDGQQQDTPHQYP